MVVVVTPMLLSAIRNGKPTITQLGNSLKYLSCLVAALECNGRVFSLKDIGSSIISHHQLLIKFLAFHPLVPFYSELDLVLKSLDVYAPRMDLDQKLCFIEMKVMVNCSFNAKCCTDNDQLLPLPKWLEGNQIPVFASGLMVSVQIGEIGDFPPYFPTTVRSVYTLTKLDLVNLAYFYNESFGVTNPHASRRVLVNAFMKFVQGQCLHKS